MRQTVITLFLFLLILGLASCKSRTQKGVAQQQESDSATVEVSNHPITDMLYAELDSADIYNDSILYGYWFKPHEACVVNIFFHKDNTYEFKYYEVGKGKADVFANAIKHDFRSKNPTTRWSDIIELT